MTNQPSSSNGAQPQADPIDIKKLAEKVYRLFEEDIRLNNARTGKAKKGFGKR